MTSTVSFCIPNSLLMVCDGHSTDLAVILLDACLMSDDSSASDILSSRSPGCVKVASMAYSTVLRRSGRSDDMVSAPSRSARMSDFSKDKDVRICRGVIAILQIGCLLHAERGMVDLPKRHSS